MDCDLIEKVSLLIDGELAEEVAAAVSAHIATCQICTQAHADFILLRQEIQAYDAHLKPFAKDHVLRDVIASRNPPLWRKRISVPVPVMAVFLIALIAVALWSAMGLSRFPKGQEANVKRIITERPSPESFDLSRFDRGDRAAIQKIKRATVSVNQ